MVETEQVRAVVAAVEAAGRTARILDRAEIAANWLELCAAFGADGTSRSTWLWSAVDDRASRHISHPPTAIRKLAELVGARWCLIFFDDYFGPVPDDSAIGHHRPGHLTLSCVAVDGASSIVAALAETSSEVCVADPGFSWALMLNHHDHLIGIGDARAWVDALPATF